MDLLKMSEPKRVNLTTISTTALTMSGIGGGAGSSAGFMGLSATAAAASLRLGPEFMVESEKSGSAGGTTANDRKTLRFSLELFQTDSSSYPEFNYSKLLHAEKKKVKKLKQKAGENSDPFAENDDDVARIAREFEKKYGSDYGSGRSRNKKDEYCDKGIGYDESDSFIDNTDAYDEVVPEEIETLEGGFYINCGALEFKKLHTETKTITDEIIKMPNRPKKRVLSSSSDESSSSDDTSDDDSGNENGSEDTKAKSSTTSSEKRTKSVSNSNITKKVKPEEKRKDTATPATSSSSSPKPMTTDEFGSDSDKERVRQKPVKTTTVKDMLKAKRDSFLKMQIDPRVLNGKTAEKGSTTEDSDECGNSSDSNTDAQDKKKKVIPTANEEGSEKFRITDTKLPELEVDLVANIKEFKEIIKIKTANGKKFQFDEKLTEIFLKIDEMLLCEEKNNRNMVFAHMEYNFGLPKYFFLRKAKQLRIKEEKSKSQRSLAKLRKAVIETMPAAITSYEMELRKYAELQAGSIDSEQPPKMPKKKFPWTANLRELLYEVYQVRWTSYPVLGTRKESLESFINVYMRDKVVELWPSGWMRVEELQKEIEKRKTAIKKAKEKEKEKKKVGADACMPPATHNINMPISLSNNSAEPMALCSQMHPMLKQNDEFSAASRTFPVVEVDLVGNNGVKRKTVESKQNKNKSPKSNGEQLQHHMLNNVEVNKKLMQHQQVPNFTTITMLDLPSSLKRTDLSVNNTMASAPLNAPMNTPPNHSLSTPTIDPLPPNSQQRLTPQKHSMPVKPATHVIDLDNYKNASDILQTSQQLLSSGVSITAMAKDWPLATITRHDSSSESDGVEIVGIFPAKQDCTGVTNTQSYRNQRNSLLKSNVHSMAGVSASSSSTILSTALNNNDSINNNNKKLPLIMNTADIDITKVLRELEENPNLQQHKNLMLQGGLVSNEKIE